MSSEANRISRRGVLKRKAIKQAADELVRDFDIRPPNASLPVGILSGGNKQKVVIARAFASEPKVLIINQPTRGVDVGAAEYIRRRMLDEREKGVAILKKGGVCVIDFYVDPPAERQAISALGHRETGY